MIVKHYYTSKLGKGDLLNNWKDLFNDRTFKRTNCNVLLDYESVETEFNSDDFNKMINLVEENCKLIRRRKIGILVTKPLLSCFLYLLGEKINDNTCYYKLFLNETDALIWISQELPTSN